MPDVKPVCRGDRGPAVRSLQEAINRRLRARDAQGHRVDVDGQCGNHTFRAARYAYYLLGGDLSANFPPDGKSISPTVQKTIRNPASRTEAERERGKRRVKKHRVANRRRQQAAAAAGAKRRRICDEAKKAAANYRSNPGAYHYLAGGVANTIYLKPTPRDWRSDCSQFAASVYKGAGLPSPAQPLEHQWASTYSMVKATGVKFVDAAHRKPGMLGMYGSRTAPHHVEIYIGDPGVEFIGHGSPPIDSLTPGQPDYYLDFPFLEA